MVERLDHIRRIEAEFQAKLAKGLRVPQGITDLMASSQVRYID